MGNGGFARGMLIGGIVGAAVSMMMNQNMSIRKNRKKMMRSGREFLKDTGRVMGEVVELFR